MIYKATKLLAQAMEEKGITHAIDEHDAGSIIIVGFSVENGPLVRVRFISFDDENDIAIRLIGLVNNVSEEKVPKMLEVLNECNREFRYLKFILDKDRDVDVEYDIPKTSLDDSVGVEACEIFIRTMSIVDKVYPKLMKVIWS